MEISTLVICEKEKIDLPESGKGLEEMCRNAGVEMLMFSDWKCQDADTEQNPSVKSEQAVVVLTCSDAGINWGLQHDYAILAFRGQIFENQCGPQELFHVPMLVEDPGDIDLSLLERVWQRKKDRPWKIGRTARCTIREIGKSDIACLYELLDGNINKDSLHPIHLSRKDFSDFWESYRETMYRLYGFGLWLVCLDHEIIGLAGIEFVDYGDGMQPEAELGYWIREAFRRQGYAREVCEFILQYAAEELLMEEISVSVKEENEPSLSLAEKLGFQKVRQLSIDGCRVQRYTKSLQFD